MFMDWETVYFLSCLFSPLGSEDSAEFQAQAQRHPRCRGDQQARASWRSIFETIATLGTHAVEGSR